MSAVTIDNITPYPQNAKAHPEKHLRQLRNIVQEVGWRQPVLVTQKGVIVAGHGRFATWQKYGDVLKPIWVIDDTGKTIHGEAETTPLTADQERIYRLADNKLNESDWEMDKVIEELLLIPPQDIELTGFSRVDLDRHEFNKQEKESLIEAFGIPPFSVWDTRQGYWQDRKKSWAQLFGDSREGRDDDLMGGGLNTLTAKQSDSKLTGTSEFDPVVAEICYRWFAPDGGNVLDPFAGGGIVRGAVAGIQDKPYLGIDISQRQIDANNELLEAMGNVDMVRPEYALYDGTNLDALLEGREYDFVFSCPPYYDLEVYTDDKSDLSNMGTYEEFLLAYRDQIHKSINHLKNNRFAAFVVGDIRGKMGEYRGFVKDTIDVFTDAGLMLWNEVILVNSVGTAAIRARKPLVSNRKITKIHQNVLIFYKGDPKEIRNNFGDIEIANSDEQ